MLITTRQLASKPVDTFLLHDGTAVCLVGVTEQREGLGFHVALEYADAAGGQYGVQVFPEDVDSPIWDYDDNDC